jgi:nucleoside-diphosphate-sugar epimerase
VRALVRPTSGDARLPPSVERVAGTLEDPASLRRLVGGARAVIHCAGAVRGLSPADFDGANVQGVARLARAATAQQPAPHIIVVSSLAARHPALSSYAASKRRGEQALGAAATDWTVLRPPAVYGPGDRELRPLLRWMARGLAPIARRDARFSVLYVDDLADAAVRLAGTGPGRGRVFELHDGHPAGYTWDDVIDAVARWQGRPVVRIPIPAPLLRALARVNALGARARRRAPMLTPGKVRELLHPDWVCDNTALTEATGWRPRVGLEEGIRRTLGAAGPMEPEKRLLVHADLPRYPGADL